MLPPPPNYNTEKKSWEYVYNYEGMDQKMIEQRQRRIALKRMFEEMTLGQQPANQMSNGYGPTGVAPQMAMAP